MDTCMAAVFTGAGRPLEIQEFPILPIERGGALVQMQMAAICGTDVHASHLDTTPAPTIFGHENIGILAEISPEIANPITEGLQEAVTKHHIDIVSKQWGEIYDRIIDSNASTE